MKHQHVVLRCALAYVFAIIGYANAQTNCCPDFLIVDLNFSCESNTLCDSASLIACENSTHTYQVIPHVGGYTYSWVVGGGTATPSGNTCVIEWWDGYNAFIEVTISDGTCHSVLRRDVCLIESPVANFSYSPTNGCSQTIHFQNLSAINNSYTWDFGDGHTSTEINPVHTYSGPGYYMVTLTVTSYLDTNVERPPSCRCSDEIQMPVIVSDLLLPPIEVDPCCFGTICSDGISRFCTPATNCGTYDWQVVGGTIIANDGDCVTVKWDGNVYPSYVQLAVANCDQPYCSGYNTLEMPVLLSSLPINGPDVLCMNEEGVFWLPEMPGTFYTWTIDPGPYQGASFSGPDRNAALTSVLFYQEGQYAIICDYHNPLAGCSGRSEFVVDIKPNFSIFSGGIQLACEDDVTTYSSNGPAVWTIEPAGPVILSGNHTASVNIQWTPGEYTIKATPVNPLDYCNDLDVYRVKVMVKPVIQQISGPDYICPGSISTYNVLSNTPDQPFLWSGTNGDVLSQSGNNGSTAAIGWQINGPYEVSVYQFHTAIPSCSSLPVSMQVNTLLPPVMTGSNVVCVDNIYTYTVSASSVSDFSYWRINPLEAGIIVSGAGTPSVDVMWHGGYTSATIAFVGCPGGLFEDIMSVSIQQPTQLPPLIANGPTRYCSDDPLFVGVNNLVLSINHPGVSYQWLVNGAAIPGATTSSYTINGLQSNATYFYTVEVFDGVCVATKTIPIIIDICPHGSVPPGPSCQLDFDVNPDPVCAGQEVVFTALSTPGFGYDFVWHFGHGAATSFKKQTRHIYQTPGTYTVSLQGVIEDVCTLDVVKTIIVHPNPGCLVTPATLQYICPGDWITLSACQGMTSYQWYKDGTAIPGANLQHYDADGQGEYWVVVSDLTGCEARSNIVNVLERSSPVVDISGPEYFCSHTFTMPLFHLQTYQDNNYSYQWAGGPVNTHFSTPNIWQTHVSVPAGTVGQHEFLLTVTDLTSGCSVTENICVTFQLEPTLTFNHLFGCEGAPLTFTPNLTDDPSNYHYQWSNGETTQSITSSLASAYFLTITDRFTGCSATRFAGIIYPKPDLGLFPLGCDTICDSTHVYVPLPLWQHMIDYDPYYTITWYNYQDYGSPIGTGPVLPVAGLNGPQQLSVVVQFDHNQVICEDVSAIFCPTVIPCDSISPEIDPCIDVMWLEQGGGTFEGYGRSIVTNVEGMVYATGAFSRDLHFPASLPDFSLYELGGRDIFVTKQDENGIFLNAIKWGGLFYDEGRGIAIGPSGSVYVTGVHSISIQESYAVVIKFDENLNEVWHQTINVSGMSAGNSIAIDADENVYVTGWILGSLDDDPAEYANITSGRDAFVARINSSDGSKVWIRRFTGDGNDEGNGVAVDAMGGISVVGNFERRFFFNFTTHLFNSTGGSDIFIARLHDNGNLIWAKRLGGAGFDHGNSLAVDDTGDVYITGDFIYPVNGFNEVSYMPMGPGGTPDAFVAKFSGADGIGLWTAQLKGQDPNAMGTGWSVDTDTGGDLVYVSGMFTTATDFDPGMSDIIVHPGISNAVEMFVTKLDASSGMLSEIFSMGAVPPYVQSGFDYKKSNAIHVDKSGCMHLTGSFQNTVDFNPYLDHQPLIPGPVQTSHGDLDVFIMKLCECCCEDSLDFYDRVNMGFDVDTDDVACTVTVSLSQFNDCQYFMTAGPDWGDGTNQLPVITPAAGLWSWTHQYSAPGTYTICIQVFEEDINGNTCWWGDLCTTVELDCCPDSTSVFIPDTMACRTSSAFALPLACPSSCGVTMVRWYIRPHGISNWTLYQEVHDPQCQPLTFLPGQYASYPSVEVYAEIFFDGTSCCGIDSLTTNIATVILCSPVYCQINNPNTAGFCDTGLPAPLEAIIHVPDCNYDSIAWLYQGVVVSDQLIYQPPQLDFTGGPNDCYTQHVFTLWVTGPCGITQCNTSIFVYNPDAPKGTLTMDPYQSQPICHGNDAIFRYDPACAGMPPKWNWYSTESDPPVSMSDYTQIPGSGENNPVIFTNRLQETTWFLIEKTNGACPVDTLQYRVEVLEPAADVSLTVNTGPCVWSFAELIAHFTPSPVNAPQDIVVLWYHNGVLLHASHHLQSPAVYHYSINGSVAGVYYVEVVERHCQQILASNIVVIEPKCSPVITGPCYRCIGDTSPIVLTGAMVIPPNQPCANYFVSGCTFQWSKMINNQFVVIPGATDLILVTQEAGTYMLTVNCGGCVIQVQHAVIDCADIRTNISSLTNETIRVSIFPNPAKADVSVVISPRLLVKGTIRVVDLSGKLYLAEKFPDKADRITISMASLPAGIYLVQVFEDGQMVWIDKIIRGQ